MDQEKRKLLCSEVQKILADDLPYLPLWFVDVVSVHRRSLGDLPLSPTGDFDFLAGFQRRTREASVATRYTGLNHSTVDPQLPNR
jgi:ABC-type transport system substrate-binding protein